MLRSRSEVKCPVAGCSKKWSRQSSTEDAEFKMEMDRFFRNAAATQSDSFEMENAVEIDEEEEYSSFFTMK